MIKSYNYTSVITKDNHQKAIKKIDDLIRKGEWDKNVPSYQTKQNLHHYSEFNIFVKTFIESCKKYKQESIDIKKFRMWCYMDHRNNPYKKKESDMWHHHITKEMKGMDGLSGIYYLRNPRNVSTLFKDVESPKPLSFIWNIFPSYLVHRSGEVKSWRKRYTLSADIFYV